MEYFEGFSIDQYNYNSWAGKNWNEIFYDLISAFEYLEKKGILHQDIRPANILINNVGEIKVIDFGFGKKLKSTEKDGRSVLLNWPVTALPKETEYKNIYNHQTEVYFVGKLFKHIIETKNNDFQFNHVLDKMIELKPDNRYKSFFEVSQDILSGVLSKDTFSKDEKEVYLDFANALSSKINSHIDHYNPINSINTTLNRLEKAIEASSLEDYIQDNSLLIRCFIENAFNYSPRKDIEVSVVIEFYKMMKNLPDNKKRTVLENIYARLNTIKIGIDDNDIPF